MTREEAIELLDNLIGMVEDNHNSDYDTAFKMAIKALEQEPSGDTIDRDELLKAIDTWDKFGVDDTNSLFRLDNLSLPHYVPYIHYDDVIKCIKSMPSVKQEPKTEQEDDYFRKIVEVAISQLRADRDRLEDELAKREQEPKTGHWMIVHRKGIYTNLVCDKCLSNAPYDCRTNYCPNCGAKMVEPQESEEV